jgi:hypothetical protein
MSLINLLSPADYNRIHHTDITSLAEAKAFIETLASNGLMFHFEDGPEDIIWALPPDRHPTEADTQALRHRADECYKAFIDWSQGGGCPIGYCLICLGNTGDIPA